MPNGQNDGSELAKIIKECNDAPGFIIFVATLQPQIETDKPPNIQFNYIRHNFSYEDILKKPEGVLARFRDHVYKDMEGEE